MAVYTEVSDEELSAFVAGYDLGAVVSCKGIAEGIENSNYLLATERGSYILTLYEKRVRREDLPFFLAFMEHLAAAGIPCPVPVKGRDGAALRELAGRPAAVVTFLAGMWPRKPTPEHCAAVGEALARLHLAGRTFGRTRANDLSLAGWRTLLAACRDRADEVKPGLAASLATELDEIEAGWPAEDALPSGVIHADLFPDNVFFVGPRLTGVIDFYFACTDFLAYDLAICLNAWCFEPDLSFNATKARRLTAGYGRVRPLGRAEVAVLPVLARGAALRFLLTRLYDRLHGPTDALVRPKDPLEYWRKLQFHRGIAGPAAYGLEWPP
jgi:homoserine kinase type II